MADNFIKDAIRKIVQRKRDLIAAAPPAPLDLESLAIPEEYRRYEFAPGQTELFLLRDTGEEGPDPQRILIFQKTTEIVATL